MNGPTSIASSEDQIVGQIPAAIDEERNQELEGCLAEEEERIDFGEGGEEDEDEQPEVDVSRITLTEEETRWAKAIKTAIEEDPEVDNLNDFLYAQIALIDKDDIERLEDDYGRE